MPTQSITRHCRQCGRLFSPRACQLKAGGGFFCRVACYAAFRTRPLAERFWEKVEKTPDCWLWRASTRNFGYGAIDGTRAHRVSWELHYGPVPEGLCVLHRCDEPRCVRPDHLFLGTRPENSADMVAKGRQPRRDVTGENSPRAKLTEAQVLEIRRRYAAGGISAQQLGREYGVAKPTIAGIVSGRNWKHLL